MEAHEVWKQRRIPVILRRGTGNNVRMRVPFSPDNKIWLRGQGRIRPRWNPTEACWELPKSWFNDLVERSLERYRQVYIVQPLNRLERCAPACQNARGHECQCSCLGANHGQKNDGSWFVVSHTFAFRQGDRELACRLLTATPKR